MNTPHPGFVLKEKYFIPSGLSVSKWAAKLGISKSVVSGILNGNISITPIMAKRLGKALGTSDEYWLTLQRSYDRDRGIPTR